MPTPKYSPATLALMARGVSHRDISDGLGCTTRSVSRWLAGEHPPPPELWGVIAGLGGRELAEKVRTLLEGQAVES